MQAGTFQHIIGATTSRVVLTTIASTLAVLSLVLTVQSRCSGSTAIVKAAGYASTWQPHAQASSSDAPERPAGQSVRTPQHKERTIFDTALAPLEDLAEKIASGYDKKTACGAYPAGSGWGE